MNNIISNLFQDMNVRGEYYKSQSTNYIQDFSSDSLQQRITTEREVVSVGIGGTDLTNGYSVFQHALSINVQEVEIQQGIEKINEQLRILGFPEDESLTITLSDSGMFSVTDAKGHSRLDLENILQDNQHVKKTFRLTETAAQVFHSRESNLNSDKSTSLTFSLNIHNGNSNYQIKESDESNFLSYKERYVLERFGTTMYAVQVQGDLIPSNHSFSYQREFNSISSNEINNDKATTLKESEQQDLSLLNLVNLLKLMLKNEPTNI